MMKSFARSLFSAFSALLLLGACQLPVDSPTPATQASAMPSDAPRMVELVESGPALPDLGHLDVVGLHAPVSAPLRMAIAYQRGVNEQVSWEGTGRGVAELTNEHGQLVYRVQEGEAPKTVTVPAGRYALTVTPDPAQPASPMLMHALPGEDGAGLERTLVDLAERTALDGTDRGPDLDLCAELLEGLRRLADLERALQFSRQAPRFNPVISEYSRKEAFIHYLNARGEVNMIYEVIGRARVNKKCGGKWHRHSPSVTSTVSASALVAPYLFTYYMRNFK